MTETGQGKEKAGKGKSPAQGKKGKTEELDEQRREEEQARVEQGKGFMTRMAEERRKKLEEDKEA